MKQILITVITILFFTSCQEKVTDTYKVNTPLYMSRAELKSSVKLSEPDEINQPGKIYFKDNFIFINEPLIGIHVIDNTNPAMPSLISFIKIPGNVDMAIKDNILYADSFIDLVALDISNINEIHEVGRVDSIFPYMLPPVDEDFPVGLVEQNKGIVVGWEVKEVEEKIQQQDNLRFFNALESLDFANSRVSSSSSAGAEMSIGIGGSMARFTIYNNTLYTVDRSNLRAFDIDNLSTPLLISDLSIGWNIETIFPYKNKLFFGTQTGMLIYDISTASSPKYISSYNHVRSCDPVVVNGDYAYVTLRAGNLCGEATSQLDVIDLSNILAPQWKQSYPMQEPYGLGIDGNMLFVCDGEAGLKVYNANDPKNLETIATFPEVNAYDVIPFNGVLMMIGNDGLYQYDYVGTEINELSFIPISQKKE